MRAFRQKNGLMQDADFGFAFEAFEDAVRVGGHFVAAEWARVRAEQQSHLQQQRPWWRRIPGGCSWILKQLQAIAEDGRGALRENPACSLWSLPQEETMMESGLWYDTTYSACVFMSAHNIQEIELIMGPLKGEAPVPVQGRSGILGHPGLRNCGLGQLVGGQRGACPTPRATDAAAGGVWPQTLAGCRSQSYAQLGDDAASHHTRVATAASQGASETAYGGTSGRRARRWPAAAGRSLRGAGPPLPQGPTVTVGITFRAGARLYNGRLASALCGLYPCQSAGGADLTAG